LRGGASGDQSSPFNSYMRWDVIGVETVTTSGILENRELVISRILFAICVAVSIIWTFVNYGESGPYGQWFTYLTEWNQLLAFIYFIFAIFSSKDASGLLQDFPFRQISYVLFQISFSSTFTVIVMFWAVIFPDEKSRVGIPMFLHISEHGIIGVWLLLEFLLNRINFMIPHLIWVVLFAILYLIFNVIYTTQVGPVYDILDYKTPFSAAIVVACLVLIVLFFFIGFGLSRLRDRLLKAQPLTASVPGGSPGGETFDGIDLELEDPSVPDIRGY